MKIIATISKNSYAREKVKEIIAAGADILRYNFGQGEVDLVIEKIQIAKEEIKFSGKDVKIMADIPGNKPRLGEMLGVEKDTKMGEILTFKFSLQPTNPREFVPFTFPELAKHLYVGEIITLADGDMGMEITEIINANFFKAKVLNDWHIPSFKAINLGEMTDKLDHISERTIKTIESLPKINPDLIAYSFITDVKMCQKLFKLTKDAYPQFDKCQLVAKIETNSGINNISEICNYFDWIMVARGDLGTCTDFRLLGINQQKLIDATRKNGKKIIIATQIMDSILDSYLPKRAEIIDLTNAVIQKVDAVMLARETGISLNPGYSVSLVKSIIDAVQLATS